MAKVLLLSVLFASIVIPLLAARAPNPRRAIRLAIVATVLFNVLYLLAIRFVYPRLL